MQTSSSSGGGSSAYADMLAIAGLRHEHIICPLFVSERSKGSGTKDTISSMPGISIAGSGVLISSVQEILDSKITSIILFGIPKVRNGNGSIAADRNGVTQRAIREIKSAFGRSINLITDVCVCQYNLSGHCGHASSRGNESKIAEGADNDHTLMTLAGISLSHAEAGADVLAPSAMMDGQVLAIRTELDKNGYNSKKILSYSAKHASSLYTPFRSAAFAKKGTSIEKATYQVSYSNPKQSMREIASDIAEGADMVMVKPSIAYLDLVARAKQQFSVPIAVQNVSGEYAMIKAAGKRGWINEQDWKFMSLAAMKRAGADRIISYFAMDVASYLH